MRGEGRAAVAGEKDRHISEEKKEKKRNKKKDKGSEKEKEGREDRGMVEVAAAAAAGAAVEGGDDSKQGGETAEDDAQQVIRLANQTNVLWYVSLESHAVVTLPTSPVQAPQGGATTGQQRAVLPDLNPKVSTIA
jgi:hypothetical protein